MGLVSLLILDFFIRNGGDGKWFVFSHLGAFCRSFVGNWEKEIRKKWDQGRGSFGMGLSWSRMDGDS